MAPQPFVPLADGAQVEVIMRQGGLIVENRLWFIDRQPPITQQHIDDLASGVAAWHTTQILPNLAVELRHVRVLASDWTADPPPFVKSVSTQIDGGNNSGIHSANVAIRVRFKGSSTQTFPSNANFVPGIPKDAVDGNKYTVAMQTILFNAYVNLIDLAPLFGPFPAWRWVITSRITGNSYRSTQDFARTDFIQLPSPYVSPRRKRLHH